ncbi:two-component system chemotaxis sensor kinase CheA [Sphaerotilus hippei]|uniref:Chemotaxis protein CheA n=1 Tax=Sphaerotilus hippei TaxID=744406 RepID=A0A318H7B0_9BURK|nr:chemotaxis protein CheA [Sphaerotilus hippei]PXW95501.1 two-component system chemotaxis sensor kinase CheA [Sphaerotilus hippei]
MNSDDEILAIARAGFLDEARDMLSQFEESLLTMEEDPQDQEAINCAFRAAHTIKGTAGLFGFDAVVSFTHEVESALDDLREGALQIDGSFMGLLLQGRDQMERLLAEIGQPDPDPEVATLSLDIGASLRSLPRRGAAAARPDADTPRGAAAEADAAAPGGTWHISLRLGEDALRNALDPLSFVRYLDRLGTVSGVRTLLERVPSLEQLDPEGSYIGFEIRLDSTASRDDIEQVFWFLQEDSDLVVLAPDASPADHEALLHRRATTEAEREALLAHWQVLAGPQQAPFIERRNAEERDRRIEEPERRKGPRERRGSDETRFIRVRADKLDHLIDLIGELVIASSGAQLVAQQEQSPRFSEAALRIHDLVQEARDGALGLRMVPIGETFSRFQRVVRDVSQQLDKDVDLQITGGDTELDKSMVETIADPLMHLVRNSMDHGLEPREERLAAGKSEQGRLALHAYHESGSIIIEVSDDGRGLDRDRILAKAVERQLVPEGQELSDEEVYLLIFQPGFSTAAQVTNLSGRGVGMDVVKRNVESMRGQIKVASQPGRGATMQIRLPLTLAIIDGFLTSVGGVSYVLPLEIVAECIEMPQECARSTPAVTGCFDLRGEVVPYIDLRLCFGHAGPRPARQSLIIVRTATTRLGLLVDRLHGEYQTVIKPLGDIFRQLEGIAGSTILGSGEVALILDVAALEKRQSRARMSAPALPHSSSSPVH